jgi:hypothetical protein
MLKLVLENKTDTEPSIVVRIASAAVSALQLFAAVYTD